jgi:uncharacterized membrane protein YgcG
MADQAVTQAVETASESLKDLSDDQKKVALQQISASVMPMPIKTNFIWIMLIAAFCICLVLAAIRISGIISIIQGNYAPFMKDGAFLDSAKLIFPDVDKVMIMFSSLVGFLAGIFVPSPAKSTDQS